MTGRMVEGSHGTETVVELDTSYPLAQSKGKAKCSRRPWTFETSKATTLWHTSSNKTTHPNPSKIVPVTGDQAFKYMNLWGPLSFKPQIPWRNNYSYKILDSQLCRKRICILLQPTLTGKTKSNIPTTKQGSSRNMERDVNVETVNKKRLHKGPILLVQGVGWEKYPDISLISSSSFCLPILHTNRTQPNKKQETDGRSCFLCRSVSRRTQPDWKGIGWN